MYVHLLEKHRHKTLQIQTHIQRKPRAVLSCKKRNKKQKQFGKQIPKQKKKKHKRGCVRRGMRGMCGVVRDPKRLRVNIQNVSVCASKTPTCSEHVGVFAGTLGGGFSVPHHTRHTRHTPRPRLCFLLCESLPLAHKPPKLATSPILLFSNANVFTTRARLLDSQHIHNTYTKHPYDQKHRTHMVRQTQTQAHTDGQTDGQTVTHKHQQTDNGTSRVVWCGKVTCGVCEIVREGASSKLLLPFVRFCLNSHHSHIQSAARKSHCVNSI